MIDLDKEEIEYIKNFIANTDPFRALEYYEQYLEEMNRQLETAKINVARATKELLEIQKRERFIEILTEKLNAKNS